MKTALVVVFGVLSLTACGKAQSKDECLNAKIEAAMKNATQDPTAMAALDLPGMAKQCGMTDAEFAAYLKNSKGTQTATGGVKPGSPVDALPSDRACRVVYTGGRYQIFRGREGMDSFNYLSYAVDRQKEYVAAGICTAPEVTAVCDVSVAEKVATLDGYPIAPKTTYLSYAVDDRNAAVKAGLCSLRPVSESKCWADTEDGGHTFGAYRDGVRFASFTYLSYATDEVNSAVKFSLCEKR